MSDTSEKPPGGFRPDPDAPPRRDPLTMDDALSEMKRQRRSGAKRRPQRVAADAAPAQPAQPADRGPLPDDPREDGQRVAEPHDAPEPLPHEREEQRENEAVEGGHEEEAAPGGEPQISVQINGQTRQVPQSELVAGYLRTQDYTQKTQQLSEQHRQFADAYQAFTQVRQQMEGRLSQFTSEASREFEKPIDWVKLAQQDPLGYAQKHARFQALQEAQNEQKRLQEMRAVEDNARKQQILQAGHNVLTARLPGWKEPAKRVQIQAELKEHAAKMGYTPEDLAGEILDPRQLLILHDSMMYQRMQGRRVQPSPPPSQPVMGRAGETPRPTPSRRQQEAMTRFQSKPNINNALDLLKARRAGTRTNGRDDGR